jgi:hypothetical protein
MRPLTVDFRRLGITAEPGFDRWNCGRQIVVNELSTHDNRLTGECRLEAPRA